MAPTTRSQTGNHLSTSSRPRKRSLSSHIAYASPARPLIKQKSHSLTPTGHRRQLVSLRSTGLFIGASTTAIKSNDVPLQEGRGQALLRNGQLALVTASRRTTDIDTAHRSDVYTPQCNSETHTMRTYDAGRASDPSKRRMAEITLAALTKLKSMRSTNRMRSNSTASTGDGYEGAELQPQAPLSVRKKRRSPRPKWTPFKPLKLVPSTSTHKRLPVDATSEQGSLTASQRQSIAIPFRLDGLHQYEQVFTTDEVNRQLRKIIAPPRPRSVTSATSKESLASDVSAELSDSHSSATSHRTDQNKSSSGAEVVGQETLSQQRPSAGSPTSSLLFLSASSSSDNSCMVVEHPEEVKGPTRPAAIVIHVLNTDAAVPRTSASPQ